MGGLVALLAPDAVITGDGGGRARALPRPLRGAEQIARALVAFYRMGAGLGATLEPVRVNGQAGIRSMAPDGRVILNPDKLGHLGPLSDLGLRPSAQPS